MSVLPVLAVLAAVVVVPVVLALAVGALLAVNGRVDAREVVGAALDRGPLGRHPACSRRALSAVPPSGARGVQAVRDLLAGPTPSR